MGFSENNRLVIDFNLKMKVKRVNEIVGYV